MFSISKPFCISVILIHNKYFLHTFYLLLFSEYSFQDIFLRKLQGINTTKRVVKLTLDTSLILKTTKNYIVIFLEIIR